MNLISRRGFLIGASSAAVFPYSALGSVPEMWPQPRRQLEEFERARVLRAADSCLKEEPRTITSAPAPRSAGGRNDYFSEGDYWWPDPKHPGGPYIRRDGESNPGNFIAHRELLLRLSVQVPALTAAWLLSGKREFAQHAIKHLRAWFIEPATRMNANLEFAQAIQGVSKGRSIGIIDTLHLVEVSQACLLLDRAGVLSSFDRRGLQAWFSAYLDWLTTSEHGRQESDEKNNHGSCWLLQTAQFATFTSNTSMRDSCRERLKCKLFPEQIAADGSFPLELARTKPYSYSLFNLDVLGMSAQVLSESNNDIWNYELPDGRGLDACFRFAFPLIARKQAWPYRHDVEYFDDLPVRQPSLLFAGLVFARPDYLQLWQRLDPDPTIPEVIRNHPIRQPLLWIR